MPYTGKFEVFEEIIQELLSKILEKMKKIGYNR